MNVLWQKGVRTKTTPDKTFQTKKTWTKLPEQKPPRTKTNHPVKTYVCMHVQLKIGGSEMCDKVWQGKGVKIGPK